MLHPTDTSELENLQAILTQIRQCVTGMNAGPVELLEQAKSITCDAVEAIETIFKSRAEDAASLIATTAKAVSILQGFTDEPEQAADESISRSVEAADTEQAKESGPAPPGRQNHDRGGAALADLASRTSTADVQPTAIRCHLRLSQGPSEVPRELQSPALAPHARPATLCHTRLFRHRRPRGCCKLQPFSGLSRWLCSGPR